MAFSFPSNTRGITLDDLENVTGFDSAPAGTPYALVKNQLGTSYEPVSATSAISIDPVGGLELNGSDQLKIKIDDGLALSGDGLAVIERVETSGDVMTGDLSMNGLHRVRNLADPLSGQDAATRSYVDNRVLKSGDTMTGDLTMSIASDVERQFGCLDLGTGENFKINMGTADNNIFYNHSGTAAFRTLDYTAEAGHNFILTGAPANTGFSVGSVNTSFAPLSMGNVQRIIEVADPVDDQDAATKRYVNDFTEQLIPQLVDNLIFGGEWYASLYANAWKEERYVIGMHGVESVTDQGWVGNDLTQSINAQKPGISTIRDRNVIDFTSGTTMITDATLETPNLGDSVTIHMVYRIRSHTSANMWSNVLISQDDFSFDKFIAFWKADQDIVLSGALSAANPPPIPATNTTKIPPLPNANPGAIGVTNVITAQYCCEGMGAELGTLWCNGKKLANFETIQISPGLLTTTIGGIRDADPTAIPFDGELLNIIIWNNYRDGPGLTEREILILHRNEIDRWGIVADPFVIPSI